MVETSNLQKICRSVECVINAELQKLLNFKVTHGLLNVGSNLKEIYLQAISLKSCSTI